MSDDHSEIAASSWNLSASFGVASAANPSSHSALRFCPPAVKRRLAIIAQSVRHCRMWLRVVASA